MAIPTGSNTLGPFAKNFTNQLEEHPGEYHAGTERTAKIQQALKNYDNKLAAHYDARDVAKAATEEKDVARDELLEVLSSTARFIKGNDEVTNAALERAGLTPRTTHRTPTRVPTEFPVGAIMNTDVLEHTLTIFNPDRKTRRAKPTGVMGCEIWLSVGDTVPKNPDDYRMVGLATRDTHQTSFKADEGGQMAHYLIRWVNSKGEPGPWSPTISATIPSV